VEFVKDGGVINYFATFLDDTGTNSKKIDSRYAQISSLPRVVSM